MSLIVDQTWVKEWGEAPSPEEQVMAVSWLKSLAAGAHQQVKQFPPMAIVKAVRTLETPCPYSVGLVAGYFEDGRIGIQQAPGTPVAACHPQDLQVVGFWKELNREAVEKILS